MKKLLFCMMVCAGFAACTSDDVVIGSSGATDFEGGDIYMKVYISDVASGTRGTGTVTDETSGTSGSTSNVYANGTASEYAVNDAKFYFYDKDGVFISRASVWDAGSENETNASVEYTSANMIVLKGLTSKQLPKYMVTILNEPSDFEDAGTYDPANTLGELEQKLVSGITTSVTSTPSGTTDYFIMSTSSYTQAADQSDETSVARSQDEMNYFVTELTDANFLEEPISDVSSSDIDAVEVYVERLAAKVSVDTSIPSPTTGSITGDEQTSYTFYPLKLDQTVGGTANDNATDISDIYVTFLGWTLNATARQSYIMKNVDDKWNSTGYWSGAWNVDTKAWNDSTRYRSYWGKGIAYGTGNFPESNITYKDVNSDGEVDITVQTDNDESSSDSSDWLNPYLQYTSLDETAVTIQQFGKDGTGNEYALYCAENTNVVDGAGTAGLKDLYSSGITSVLLKAQACTYNETSSTYDPLALVRYEGELFTADEFKNTIVRQEVHYDFANAETLAYEELNSTIADYLLKLFPYMETEIYCSQKASPTADEGSTTELFTFDGSFLNLVDLGDGNVGVWPKTSTAVHGAGNDRTAVQPTLKAYWDEQIISGYGAEKDLDEYDMYFKLTCSKEEFESIELLPVGNFSITVGTVFSDLTYFTDTNGATYLLLDDTSAMLTGVNSGSYTLRQYFIRAIEKEALQTNLYFLGYALDNNNKGNNDAYSESGDGIIETNFYKDGLMYYSVPIEHLVEASTTSGNTTGGDTTTSKKAIIEGQYGVVRNHWYQLDITSLSKLGRGISDETAVIIPDPNGTDYLSVVANVNINAWQTVTQKKEL